MIWSIAWKNVWRNKTRSLVVIIAVTLGLFGGLFATGVMIGMINQRVDAALNNEISHIQLHNPKFLENNEIEYTITNADSIVKAIEKIPEVKAVCRRSEMVAMASTSAKGMGATLIGIQPEKEMQVTDIHKYVLDSAGTYFQKGRRNPMVLSRKLADELQLTNYIVTEQTLKALSEYEIPKQITDSLKTIKGKRFRKETDFDKMLTKKIGDKSTKKYVKVIKQNARKFRLRSKVVMQLQGMDGHLTGGAFRISGIFETNNMMFDGRYIFVESEDINRITGFDESQSHEIAVLLHDMDKVQQVAKKMKDMFPQLEVQTWKDIQPDLAMTTDFMSAMFYVFIIIILFALGFGIVNTMLMVVLERVKELGMLMAVGMNKPKVFGMIMLETIFLSLTGAAVGMGLSWVAIWYFGKTGIDLSSMFEEGLEAVGYAAVLYPEITFDYYAGVTLLVILTGIVASAYPARKALKLNPAEATRIDI